METPPTVVIIGGGPAGLMAADVLSQQGTAVALYDAMPTVGRKFLLAGKGGLNLTHAEPLDPFLSRYGRRRPQIEPLLAAFGPADLRRWAHDLGISTFVGSSQRVFPSDMKAAPLLRAWLRRLRANGVVFHVRHRWCGWGADHSLLFATPEGETAVSPPTITLLALGGGSWPRLGSTGDWVPLLTQRGIPVAPLQPSNCGFDVNWSDHMRRHFAGTPVKTVALTVGEQFRQQGEFVISETGVEGSLIYAASALLRDALAANGRSSLHLDLTPQRSLEWLRERLAQPRGKRSLSNHLQSKVGLKGVKTALLHEFVPATDFNDPHRLARTIKALPIPLQAPRPLAEAISSAGGVLFEALDNQLMVRSHPGLFCAGEMLDWEAPTGGYLLTACLASGYVAGHGARAYLPPI